MIWLLVPLTALFNRLSGANKWVPFGRNVYVTAPAIGVAAWLLSGHWLYGLTVFVAYATYRLPGWYKLADIGSVSGDPLTEFFGFTARTMFIIPFMVLYDFPHGELIVAAGVVASFASAIAYAVEWWSKLPGTGRGIYNEVATGAFLGAFFAVSSWV